jgi:LPS export ABC transporter protein LptC
MGKKLVIVGFLICCALAAYVFASREKKSLRDNLKKSDEREPRVVMEDFVMYRYAGDRLVGKLAARLGHFYEPNLIELDGEIRGERLTPEGIETAGAESATAYFKATSLTAMMREKTELDRAEFTGFVEVGVKEHLLTTDYAEYLNDQRLIRSLRPVRVEGPGRIFSGDEGFTYSLVSQVLEMQGSVKGVVTLNEKP